MNWRDIRVGIVGLGAIGRSHTERLLEHGVTVVGGMDTDARANEQFSTAYGVDAYEDAQELFAAVDAVVVATPNCHHEEYAVAALDAGCCVLLEKPVAHTLDSAERIADAARWSTGFCMVGFSNRFANSVEVLKTFQRRRRFGDVLHVEANYIRRRGVPGVGSWFTDHGVAGGGALIDIGVHALDLALYVLDFPPVVEITAATRSTFGSRGDYASIGTWDTNDEFAEYDVDDSVSAFIRTANGTTVTLEAAWATNRPENHEFLLRGTDAGARFDRASDTLTLYESTTEGVDHLADTEICTRQNDTLAAEQAAFLEGVARGVAPAYNTLEQGIAVQRLINAIYRSARAGRTVRLAEPTEAKATDARTVHWAETNGFERPKQRVSSQSQIHQQAQNNDDPRPPTAERMNSTTDPADDATESGIETP